MIADTLKADPSKLVVGNDARKAYQNFDRDSLWGVVDTEFPEIANMVRLCYGVPSAVILQDAGLGDPVVLLNGVGARQGCPLGSLIYCIAQHPILVEVAEAHQVLDARARPHLHAGAHKTVYAHTGPAGGVWQYEFDGHA